ncbi:probable glutathione S-transferase GSTU6 [Triticum dicoccoides]|uniref:probable glutathione S-transferase GSTU6 n=1 Tax=Triticum dicoccoides TaxID=85692 RepID=UPI00188E746F|nr:probable glutathione S-transferase GSTU6 [Triticum dicoccoides]
MAEGGDELKLLGSWSSPYVTRAKLALAVKGLSYENVDEDVHNKSGLLLASNPVHKKIPVLIHSGVPVCESMIIVQYIDEAFAGTGPPILPADPHERAVARFWAAYVDDKLVSQWTNSSRGKAGEGRSAEAMKEMVVAVEALEGALRECSKGKGFFGGDGVGLVDIALGSMHSWLMAIEAMSGAKVFDPARTPLLAAWMERFGALDAARAVLPDVGRVVELAKIRHGQAAAASTSSNNKQE